MLERVLTVIGQIYDTVLGDEEWSVPLVALGDYCGMESAALVVVDNALAYASVTAPRADPAIVSAYNADWWQYDPTVEATRTAPVGQLTSLATNTGRKEFLGSAFYGDFWVRSGLGAERIATNLALSDNAFASCVVHASVRHDEIDNQALRRFATFTPHLVRAVALRSKIQRLTIEKARLEAGGPSGNLATVVVDGEGCLVFADEAGERLLASGKGIGLRNGQIALAEPNTHMRLMRAVAVACGAHLDLAGSGPVCLARGDYLPALVFDILPCASTRGANVPAGKRRAALLRIREAADQPAPAGAGRGWQKSSIAEHADGGRFSRLAALKIDIQENHANPALSLAWLARRHGMTPRAVRNLFYSENTNFTAYLMRVRLDHARDMLADPRYRDANIAAIALEAGFGDLSWFHQVFRRRFGERPAELRARLKLRDRANGAVGEPSGE
jgi:AraC-like DNA-binding protein